MHIALHNRRKEHSPADRELTVYAIGGHFISPLHTRGRELQNSTAARSHGLLVSAGLRKLVRDFSTRVPTPNSEGASGINPASYPVDPVYMVGNGPDQGTVQKHPLSFSDGKWEDDNEVVALEREGAEVGGMLVLSAMKNL